MSIGISVARMFKFAYRCDVNRDRKVKEADDALDAKGLAALLTRLPLHVCRKREERWLVALFNIASA